MNQKKKISGAIETAEAVGVRVDWLVDQAKAGLIPCVPIGKRHYLFNIPAVEECLAQRAAAPVTPKASPEVAGAR